MLTPNDFTRQKKVDTPDSDNESLQLCEKPEVINVAAKKLVAKYLAKVDEAVEKQRVQLRKRFERKRKVKEPVVIEELTIEQTAEELEAEATSVEAEEDPEYFEYPLEVREILSFDTIKELIVAFEQYKDGESSMSTDLVELMIRSMGYNPTVAYLEQCVNSVDEDSTGQFTLDMFILLASKIALVPLTDEDVIEAFRNFDPDNLGYIDSKLMEMVLTTDGERLDKIQVETLLHQGDLTKKERVSYRELVKRMGLVLHIKNIDSRRKKANKIKKDYEKKRGKVPKPKKEKKKKEKKKKGDDEVEDEAQITQIEG